MKPVTQTLAGGHDLAPELRGDCLPACIASILEVPLEAVSIPHRDDEHWWDTAQAAVAVHGFRLIYADAKVWTEGLWIAGVPSLNLKDAAGQPLGHVIVMDGGQVAHDPAIGQRYATGTPIDELEVGMALVLAPAAYGARARAELLADTLPRWRCSLDGIRIHGTSGLWDGHDCAVAATAVLEGEDAARALATSRTTTPEEGS